MKMNMKKLMLATVLAAISSQSMAKLSSQGTATATMSFTSGTQWSISKGADGTGVVNPDGTLRETTPPSITIKNDSPFKSFYYIKPFGESLDPSHTGNVLFVHETEKKQTYSAFEGFVDAGFTLDEKNEALKSASELDAKGEVNLPLPLPTTSAVSGIAGKYNATMELLIESP